MKWVTGCWDCDTEPLRRNNSMIRIICRGKISEKLFELGKAGQFAWLFCLCFCG
jgi:hypothetical protein